MKRVMLLVVAFSIGVFAFDQTVHLLFGQSLVGTVFEGLKNGDLELFDGGVVAVLLGVGCLSSYMFKIFVLDKDRTETERIVEEIGQEVKNKVKSTSVVKDADLLDEKIAAFKDKTREL